METNNKPNENEITSRLNVPQTYNVVQLCILASTCLYALRTTSIHALHETTDGHLHGFYLLVLD